jgi:hypothetical protein
LTIPTLVPRGDALRHAIAWLAEHGEWSAALVDEACRRFDIAPVDEEFLLSEWRRVRAERGERSAHG